VDVSTGDTRTYESCHERSLHSGAALDVTLWDACEVPVGRVEGGQPGLKAGDGEHCCVRIRRLVALNALQSTHAANHESLGTALYAFEVSWGLARTLVRCTHNQSPDTQQKQGRTGELGSSAAWVTTSRGEMTRRPVQTMPPPASCPSGHVSTPTPTMVESCMAFTKPGSQVRMQLSSVCSGGFQQPVTWAAGAGWTGQSPAKQTRSPPWGPVRVP
jgi:hypothetical protein